MLKIEDLNRKKPYIFHAGKALWEEQEKVLCLEYINNKVSLPNLGKKYGIDRRTVSRILRMYGLGKLQKRYKVNENYFKVIDTEEKAYWLGFITADGCIHDRTAKSHVFNITLNEID